MQEVLRPAGNAPSALVILTGEFLEWLLKGFRRRVSDCLSQCFPDPRAEGCCFVGR